jgi:hypothetical protein
MNRSHKNQYLRIQQLVSEPLPQTFSSSWSSHRRHIGATSRVVHGSSTQRVGYSEYTVYPDDMLTGAAKVDFTLTGISIFLYQIYAFQLKLYHRRIHIINSAVQEEK